MSWHGTVQCSHCCARGHNRRSCPQRKEYVKQNPDSYEARVMKREQNSFKYNSSGKRRCSYCENTGHNRATCKAMKVDKIYANKKNRKFLSLVTIAMKKMGLGVGALISKPHWDTKEQELFMITKVDWRKVDMLAFESYSNDSPVTLRKLSDNSAFQCRFEFFDDFINELVTSIENKEEFKTINSGYSYSHSLKSEVISPLSPDQVAMQIPKSFEKASVLRDRAWYDQTGKKEARRYVQKDFKDPSFKLGE